MAWVLEFHILNHRSKCEALRKEGKDDETVDCASVQFCINLEALNLVPIFLGSVRIAEKALPGGRDE